ncbi:hypothetical protein F444_07694 [Phytophthora nicotianae P1976]|uniref:Uncharacterized protein n=1 Tax=Phytophthora nicotianae P1976 TaxID=1317066 RepID=A0A081ADV0_PHYNI|nr:hypothetical protein F444_07694 [Phytophthora nicotianae P1976]
MWTRVKEVMESSERVGEAIAKGTLEPRAWTSLSAHLGQMQKAIAKYVGCMKLVESLRESGSTERDMMQKSLSLYKERHGHHFGYMECYDVLAKCPKFQLSVEKVSERKKPARSSKRPGPDNVIVEASLESDANSIISTTVEARPDQGVKGTKRAISEVSMRFRTVVAQETLSKSMISKVDVLKKQLRINQALQRIQVEETPPPHAEQALQHQAREC